MEEAKTASLLTIILLAGVGGFVLNMMNLWEDSKKPIKERVPKDTLYWIFFLFWPLAGAGLAWLYVVDGSSLRPFLAFSVGLSAPATIQAMVAKATLNPSTPPPGAEP